MTARPLIAVGLCLVIPIAGIAAAGTLEEQFFPSVDRDQFQIEVEFAAHRAIEETRADVLQMRDFLKQNPQVLEVHWFVGESAPKFFYNFTGSLENSPYYAQALVQLTSERNIRSLIRSLQADLSRSFPDARILVRQLEQGPPFEAPVEFRIYGPDVEELRRLGAEVRRILAGVAEVVHVRDDLTETLPKLGLLVDEEQAVQAGLTNTDIAQQLQTTLEGAVGGSILESVENLPIRVRVADADRANLAEIASLDLISTQDQDLEARSLTALGQFELVPQLSQIARRNEQRVNTVQGFINAGVLPSTVLSDFQRALEAADFQLPPGYRSELGGEYAERNEAVGNLVAYVGLLMLVMVTALVLSLGSFRQTGIVAIVAIGSVGMALFSLWAFEVVFGFMAVVGTMGLIGIAINGSIIVLSALNEDERAQQGDQVAIQAVVVKATRHVLTTTVTTMVGFIPLLISGGDFWEPLSVAIAGGIGGSPLLALYMTPAAYLLIKGKRRRTHRSILVSPPVQVHPEVVKH